MSKAAVIFWSQTGNTEQMANAIADGIREGGMEVDVLNVADTTPADAVKYKRSLSAARQWVLRFSRRPSSTRSSPSWRARFPAEGCAVRLLAGATASGCVTGTAYQRRKRCHLHR